MEVKVSVIVPIYKVEKYIERCVSSLLEQTLPDMEFIFVNDCTPDRSMEILEKTIQLYPWRINQVRILEHIENKGLPTARNTGLSVASGCYIAHCDSDDWIEPDMYEKMYTVAIKEKADLIGCDFFHEYLGDSAYCKQNFDKPAEIQLKDMLRGSQHMGGHIWCRLVKRDLYLNHHIHFPDGINMWEDLVTSFKLHFFANKIAYFPKPLYHYIQYNENSIVVNVNQRQLENMIDACRIIERFLYEKEVYDIFCVEFMERVYFAKKNLLLDDKLRNYDLWQTLWPEAHSLIKKYDIAWYNKCIFVLAHHKYYRLASILYRFKHSLSQRLRTL